MAMTDTRVVVPLSGGLDSAVAAALAVAAGAEVIAISYRYGQRNQRELEAADVVARKLGVGQHYVIDVALSSWGGSRLFAGTEDSASSYYVPGRNSVFAAIALSLAESRGADAIHLGFTAADRRYPDATAEYLTVLRSLAALTTANAGRPGGIAIDAPLIAMDKLTIVRKAIELQVPVAETWSCYAGGVDPCGCCDACRIRDLSLIRAGVPELATGPGRAAYDDGAERATENLWRFLLRD
ncbi:7-cyano-7-deazaguanine synthase QueC [Nocardia brasiliensis]|uniref:7-cyano-7-deazaguanine synthase n=1 Tax=Nocardia brasiliensis (strain ATCC 700358 / HUJEG-1) TaxID=1133849 RepID=K0ES65_NOCB7|nr:7-cyano-7-deazaguanine synthase QueC [Nocardia brasiliensis]AFU02653.1 transcriptional regulator [Nocardia brasiliensis ATCC 700358]